MCPSAHARSKGFLPTRARQCRSYRLGGTDETGPLGKHSRFFPHLFRRLGVMSGHTTAMTSSASHNKDRSLSKKPILRPSLSLSIRSRGKTTPSWSGTCASPTSLWLGPLPGSPTYQAWPANPERPPQRLRAYRRYSTIPGGPSPHGAVSLRQGLLIPTHISPFKSAEYPARPIGQDLLWSFILHCCSYHSHSRHKQNCPAGEK
jgi:hypothetical protein